MKKNIQGITTMQLLAKTTIKGKILRIIHINAYEAFITLQTGYNSSLNFEIKKKKIAVILFIFLNLIL